MTKPLLPSLQILRALAAMGVVIIHAWIALEKYASASGLAVPTVPWSLVVMGNAGVDVFFVVSGFQMAYVGDIFAGRPLGATLFLKKRFVRIVPLYWFYTSLFVIIAWVLPTSLQNFNLAFWHTLASYFFVPWPRAGSGTFHPVLFVGWTLNLEMVFYFLVAFSLSQPLKSTRYIFLFVPLLAMAMAGLLHHNPASLWQHWFANSLLCRVHLWLIVGIFLHARRC